MFFLFFRSPQEQATVLSAITKMLNKRYAQSGTASSWLAYSSFGLLLKYQQNLERSARSTMMRDSGDHDAKRI
jgi:hypothetical protein